MKVEEVNQFNSKLIRPEKIMYFLVIYLMFYPGKKRAFCRDMGIGLVMLDAWMREKQGEAEECINSLKRRLKDEIKEELGIDEGEKEPVPTVDSIKNHILRRLHDQVKREIDPAKLAGALKVLQKYGTEMEEKRSTKKTSIYDEIKNGGK